MHENGVLTKQSSPYFQTVACHNNITKNVMYNGPRAGKSPSLPKCLCSSPQMFMLVRLAD